MKNSAARAWFTERGIHSASLSTWVLFFLALWMVRCALAEPKQATIYRDEFGIPHIFADTLESAAYGVGYAQAEDRLEELLKNYRRANGTMSEVFGPEYFRQDLIQRMWR